MRQQKHRDVEQFTLTLAGYTREVSITRAEMETVHTRILNELAKRAASHAGRFITFLAGPPGCGKTTLTALWEALARQQDQPVALQALPMDGFHFPNGVLGQKTVMRDGEEIPLQRIKGAPESYNLTALTTAVHALRSGKKIRWPRYDRNIHDPVPDDIPVPDSGILVLEGNYLLLDAPGWRELRALADFTIFVELPESRSRRALLRRHQRGGRSLEEAVAAYQRTDLPNRKLIMDHRLQADATITLTSRGMASTLAIENHL
jgi:putative kinase